MRWLAKILISSSLVGGLLAAGPAQAAGIIHVVQPGENLFRIGLAYGIGWEAIMQANGLTSTNIYVGESLIIPVAGSGTTPPPPHCRRTQRRRLTRHRRLTRRRQCGRARI